MGAGLQAFPPTPRSGLSPSTRRPRCKERAAQLSVRVMCRVEARTSPQNKAQSSQMGGVVLFDGNGA
eukprot:4627501-Prymnesium_polylepis.1